MIAKGLAALRERRPEVADWLERSGPPGTIPVHEDGWPIDLDLGDGTLLYGADARQVSADQVEAYLKAPDRLLLGDVKYCNLSRQTETPYNELRAALKRRAVRLAELPVVDSGYLFCFGVGLGYHLPLLLDRLAIRHLVIIEPLPEFLGHSLAAIDWASLFEAADRRGVAVSFVLADDADAIAADGRQQVAVAGNTFLEGSYFYTHYPLPLFSEAQGRLRGLLKLHYTSPGYFEDELRMAANTYENLKSRGFRLIEERPPAPVAPPAFIVGSGPSLDQDWPALSRWRDRGFLFSCGSSLRVLLARGVRPDFHCELENGPHIPEIVGSVAAEFGLAGITLIASTTVDPRLPALFETTCFFFRDSVSSTGLFAGGAAPLSHAEPTVANVALAAAAAMGFHSVVLFGVDCGIAEGGAHHAADSLYFQDEFRHLDPGTERYDRVVPGNFGGSFRTDWIFDLSRWSLGQVQGFYGLSLVNCSNGARIEGAIPRAGPALSFAGPALRRDRPGPTDRLPAFAPGAFLTRSSLDADAQACRAFQEGFPALLAQLAGQAEEFWDADQALKRFELGSVFLAKAVMVPLSNLLRAAAQLGTRIAEPAERRAFLRDALAKIGAAGAEMAALVQEKLGSDWDG